MAGASSQGIVETAARYTKGEVDGQSLTFAPTIAEFTTRVRQFDDMMVRRNRLPAPTVYRGNPGLRPFEIKIAKAKADHAHLPVIAEDVTYDQWRKMSAAREVPVGAVWVACLATVYGPEPKQQSAAA